MKRIPPGFEGALRPLKRLTCALKREQGPAADKFVAELAFWKLVIAFWIARERLTLFIFSTAVPRHILRLATRMENTRLLNSFGQFLNISSTIEFETSPFVMSVFAIQAAHSGSAFQTSNASPVPAYLTIVSWRLPNRRCRACSIV